MELILAALIGVLCGSITGLAPGIHANLVCAGLVALFPFLPFSPIGAVVFIIALATAHTFLDALPSVFLGAPSSSDIMSVLPGHRYLLEGKGLVAVRLSNLGALAGIIVGLAAFPLFTQANAWFALVPKTVLGWILLAIPLLVALKDNQRIAALCIMLLASAFGWLGLQNVDPLFPMLSGMFGTATLIMSLGDTNAIPPQHTDTALDLSWTVAVRVIIGGIVAGGLTAILPGVGAAHAAIIGMLFAAGSGDAGFLLLTGVIGTANFFLSLAAYASAGSARNGALLTATAIAPHFPLSAAIGAAMFAAGTAFLLTVLLGKHAARLIGKLPYQKLTIGVITLVTALVLVLNGIPGLVLYVTGTAIGLLAPLTGTARAHGMACILVPIGLRFVGL